MATLITVPELALFSRRTIASDDPLALLIIELASGLVCDTAEHPDWELTVTPPRAARRICLQVAARAFTNPEMETAYNIGPLGGRVLDWAAYGLTLTPPEEEELEDLQGVPGGTNGIWIQPLADSTSLDLTVYVDDPYGLQTIPYLDPAESDGMTPLVP